MPGEIVKATVPITFTYKNRVGHALEQYINGLKDKKILGVKCPTCKKVYVPPRTVCGKCHKPVDQMTELDPQGVLKNFTVAHVTIVNGEIKNAPQPYIIGMIKLNGASSLLSAIIKVASVSDVKTGIKVKAVWKDATQGDYNDLMYFEPVQ